MFQFVTLENVVNFLYTVGLDVSLVETSQLALIYILCNILYLITWIFILSLCYKIIVRVKNLMF